MQRVRQAPDVQVGSAGVADWPAEGPPGARGLMLYPPIWNTQPIPGRLLFGKLHFAGQDLGCFSFYNGLPVFSAGGLEWIHACTGQHAVFPPLPADPAVATQPSSRLDLCLPPRTLIESYFDFYQKSHIKLEFPVVDSAMFQDTFQTAYGQVHGMPSPASLIARACVFAFISMISFFEGEAEFTNVRADGSAYALKAQHLLSGVGQDISITALQTMLMLVSPSLSLPYGSLMQC